MRELYNEAEIYKILMKVSIVLSNFIWSRKLFEKLRQS